MTRLFILPAIFVAATFALWLLICNAPEWSGGGELRLGGTIRQLQDHADPHRLPEDEEGEEHVEAEHGVASGVGIPLDLPTQFENFTAMADRFKAYKQRHAAYITTLFISAYLYKQTFAIPGSFLLNIIAGAVFGLWSGFLLCCVLTTVGSTLCYLFSEFFSREYVLYYFGEKITYLQRKVDDNSHRLLAFLLFARMFPISPSWLLNIVAPFLNIPLPIFAFSVFIGLAPYNFICAQAGHILADLHSWQDVFSTGTMLKLSSFALLPLCYAMFVKARRKPNKGIGNGIKTIPMPIKIRQFQPSRLLLPFHPPTKGQPDDDDLICFASDRSVA